MTIASAFVKVIINFNDPDLVMEKREEEVQKFLPQLRQFEDIEDVGRVADPNPPESSKGFGFLIGLLQAEVSIANFKKLSSFLAERLADKSIEMEVEANGKRLKLSVGSKTELEAALQAAQDFVNSSQDFANA